MIKIVNIYLVDTGYTDTALSGTQFSTFASATTAQKQAGEFRVANTVTLKITALNFGIGTQNQDTPNISNTLINLSRLSVSPIKFSVTGFLEKQTNYNNTSDTKDISSLRDLALMCISKGHKDLYVEDTTVTAREDLTSIGQLDKDFGVEDAGSGSTRRHLNVRVDGISLNESTKTVNYNINFTLVWGFTDVE